MIAEIDVLKGLAIIAVIVLHLIPNLYTIFSPYPPFTTVSQILLLTDQLLRFCVPLFIAISGFILTKSFLNRPQNYFEFVKRRLAKVLPLYLLWLVIIYVSVHLVPGWSGFSNSFPIWQNVFLGRMEYHLYFVPLIFQLYLLFPIFFFLTKKHGNTVLIVSLAIQLLALHLDANLNLTDLQQYTIFTSWIFYFCLGIFLSLHESQARNRVTIVLAAIAMIFGLIISILDSRNSLLGGGNVINTTFFTRLPIFFYASSCVIFSMSTRDFLSRLPIQIFSILKTLGQQSYLIYLCHTLIIRIIFEVWFNRLTNIYSLFFVIALVALGVLISSRNLIPLSFSGRKDLSSEGPTRS